jgi:hypothetical protein
MTFSLPGQKSAVPAYPAGSLRRLFAIARMVDMLNDQSTSPEVDYHYINLDYEMT